ncbi:MAG: prepilin peptidase [Aeromonas sp.]
MTLLTDFAYHAPWLYLGWVFLFSLAVGSFLNVVIHRLPIMLERQWRHDYAELMGETPAPSTRYNLLLPRSRCPQCDTQLSARENIPLLSWLWQRGRCRHCQTPIAARYPLVELGTALLSMIVASQLPVGWITLAALLLTWALIALTCIDVDHLLLPDEITLPLLWLGLLVNLWNDPAALNDAVIGAAVGYLVLWSLYWLFKLTTGKEGMGYGDFKLLAALGAWLGWQALPIVLLLSSLAGALIGIAMVLVKRHERSHPIPFGPYLAIAGWVALLWGETISETYLHWIS